jgi:two-component system, NtrC family, sensor kinase
MSRGTRPRAAPGAFPENQITPLKTFADQAVIAIENVRLFTELEARNRALSESLEQQTATSEVPARHQRSPTDVQPVFDTIVRNARRLCDADSTGVLTYDGEMIRLESLDNANPEQAAEPVFETLAENRWPMREEGNHADGGETRVPRPRSQ